MTTEYPFAKYFLFVIVMSISVCSGTPRPVKKQRAMKGGGESVQVNMAWIVNEKDIKNLYLNLNGTGGCYEITENMCHTGVVYVGKE